MTVSKTRYFVHGKIVFSLSELWNSPTFMKKWYNWVHDQVVDTVWVAATFKGFPRQVFYWRFKSTNPVKTRSKRTLSHPPLLFTWCWTPGRHITKYKRGPCRILMPVHNSYSRKMVQEKILKYGINTLKVIGALFCLYSFICSLDVLSTAFKLLAGQAMGKY